MKKTILILVIFSAVASFFAFDLIQYLTLANIKLSFGSIMPVPLLVSSALLGFNKFPPPFHTDLTISDSNKLVAAWRKQKHVTSGLPQGQGFYHHSRQA